LLQRGDEEGIIRVVREGQRRGLPLYDSSALNNLGVGLNQLSRNEEMLAVAQEVLEDVRRTGRGFGDLSREAAERNMRAVIASHHGEAVVGLGGGGRYGAGQDLEVEGAQAGVEVRPLEAVDFIRAHDIRHGLSLSGPTQAPGYGPGGLKMDAGLALEDWPGAIAAGEPELAAELADPRQRQVAIRQTAPNLAIAYAHAGRLAEAQALIARTPLDCDACVQARAQIAEIAGDRADADRRFAEAVRMNPSMPQANTIWGAALLARGDVDGAIAKLEAASTTGPHFADLQELWGEALMRKGDHAGAIAKFALADKSAPRWGRNHMMWGEALMLSGRYAEARTQFEVANGLDLSKPDRAALGILLRRTASGPLHG
jgi:Flp pilus assembly protein TadD